MRTFSFRFSASVVSLLAVVAARADVTYYDLFKDVVYEQTSSAQPTTPTSFDFGARIFTDTDGDVTEATIDFDSGGQSRTLNPVDARQVGYFDYGYADDAALDAAYPTGDYLYTATLGTLAGQTGTLTLPATVRANEVPYFTGASYNDLTTALAGQDVSVSFNGFTVPSQVSFEQIYLLLVDTTANTVLFNQLLPNASASYTIPGADRVAGHSYNLALYYDPRYSATNAGFNGVGDVNIGFDSVTNLRFSVQAVPEPTSFAALGLGVLALLRRKRPR